MAAATSRPHDARARRIGIGQRAAAPDDENKRREPRQ